MTKQGPYNISTLFGIALKKYLTRTVRDDKKKEVKLPPFKFLFASSTDPVLDTTMEFYNGTFNDLARFRNVYNKTTYAVGNNTYLSEAVIACQEVFVFYCCQYRLGSNVVRDVATIMIKDANVRIAMSFDLTPNSTSVELVKEYFCDLRNRHHMIAGLNKYSRVEREVADKIYDHFLTHHKRLVDQKLFQQFNIAIYLSRIEIVLNMTRYDI